jgi:hypothetical protein
MDEINVDKTNYDTTHTGDLDTKAQALWTFLIQERNICFWGRYPDAVSTAKQYAHCHGVDHGTITLVDCTGSVRGLTKH